MEDMEARYLTDESGERIGVVLDVAEYERLRRSAEEAARMELHPGIAFRGTEGSRRAWVPGTAFDVWEIIGGYRDFGSLERLLAESQLQEHHARLALRYAEAYPDEIERAIEANRLLSERATSLYPTLFAER